MLRRNPRGLFHELGVASPNPKDPKTIPDRETQIIDLYLSIRDDPTVGRWPGRHLIEADAVPPAFLGDAKSLLASHWMASRDTHGPSALPYGFTGADYLFSFELLVAFVRDEGVPTEPTISEVHFGGTRVIDPDMVDVRHMLYQATELNISTPELDDFGGDQRTIGFWKLAVRGICPSPFGPITENSALVVLTDQWLFEYFGTGRGRFSPIDVTGINRATIDVDQTGLGVEDALENIGWHYSFLGGERLEVEPPESHFMDVEVEDVT